MRAALRHAGGHHWQLKAAWHVRDCDVVLVDASGPQACQCPLEEPVCHEGVELADDDADVCAGVGCKPALKALDGGGRCAAPPPMPRARMELRVVLRERCAALSMSTQFCTSARVRKLAQVGVELISGLQVSMCVQIRM